MYMTNLKNCVGFMHIHNPHEEKKKICAVVGINTPLFPLVSMLIKMNRINFNRKDRPGNEFNEK